MTLKLSLEPSARPPETTVLAACRSGRSDFCASIFTKHVCVDSAHAVLNASTAEEPPSQTALNDSRRTTPTTMPALTSTTVITFHATVETTITGTHIHSIIIMN